jgi:hypothetical protein
MDYVRALVDANLYNTQITNMTYQEKIKYLLETYPAVKRDGDDKIRYGPWTVDDKNFFRYYFNSEEFGNKKNVSLPQAPNGTRLAFVIMLDQRP